MTIIETALRSYRYLLTHKYPDELKQIACVNAALDELATLTKPSEASEDGKRDLPIDESNLLLLGFIKGDVFNGEQLWEFVVTIEDPSVHEWARIVMCRGNGSDPACWDMRFIRQDGNTMRPLDRVTLKYGARKMGEVIDLIRAIAARSATGRE